jgi:hypothetical protein
MRRLDSGISLGTVATQLVDSAEFRARHGSSQTVDVPYITALYRDGLGREPDPEGLARWSDTGANGATRATVLAAFAASEEAIEKAESAAVNLSKFGDAALLLKSCTLPAEFDPVLYRRSYADLAGMSDSQLRDHYFSNGIKEGRIASCAGERQNFLRLVPLGNSVLEIGPFCNPCLVGDRVRYFDVLDKAGLISRAQAIGFDHSRVPNIDYVSPTGDLSVISERFESVLSSHCIEHQPDLIRHLNDVANLLHRNGLYFLLIPDKRYCFDHFIRESTIADVIDAHFSRRIRHTAKSVIEHRALTTHNDPGRHWRGDHGHPFTTEGIQRVRDAIKEFDSNRDSYIDVHAWQFTPESFRGVTEQIDRLGFAPVRPLRIYQTLFGSNEFCAILQRS